MASWLCRPSRPIGTSGTEQGQLNAPRNLAIGPDGNLFVADSGNHRIQVFTPEGDFVTTWGCIWQFGRHLSMNPGGLPLMMNLSTSPTPGTSAFKSSLTTANFVAILGEAGEPAEGETGGGLFFGPRDILILPDGNLLITDTGNHRLQILTPDGEFVQAIGSQGFQSGQFYEPVGLGSAGDDLFYVADTWNGRIQQFSSNLFPLFSWEVDAWQGESTNNKPYLAVNDQGQIFVTDPEAYRVLIFNSAGEYLGRFGQFSTGSDGFGLPTGIKVDSDGNVYIVDAANNTVLKFAPPLGDPSADINSPANAVEEQPFEDSPQEEVPVEE